MLLRDESRLKKQALLAALSLLIIGPCALVKGLVSMKAVKPFLGLDLVSLQFIENMNEGKLNDALGFFAEDCSFDFSSFSKPCVGLDALERRLRLMKDVGENKKIMVEECISDKRVVSVKFRIENYSDPSRRTRGSAFFVSNDEGLIQNGFWVQESSIKGGESGLNLLRGASRILALPGLNPAKNASLSCSQDLTKNIRTWCAPVEYFAAWNRRDIEAAVDLFDDDITYDDTAFPNPFVGKEAAKRHLLLCAECFPNTFTFEVEDVIDTGKTVCIKWHVANNGEELPFTRGLSFYKINSFGKIRDGIDFVEPAVFKFGGVELVAESLKGKIEDEPIRLIPLVVWVAYVVIVFFSDGILPGANAMVLEQRTWEEVRDLSLNFFLVSPILNLPFSPVVHPMLEGVFNLLLSWAAMFAGFLSDDRKDKPSNLPMLPMVIGMQFLTSAFLLPYLVTRSSEQRTDVSEDDLSVVAKVCENPLFGILMGTVGSVSIGWAFYGRHDEFGTFNERWLTFLDLLSIDRVGSSFFVDLAIFGLFQGWLIDDDMQRRGMLRHDHSVLNLVAKFVPFFGMAAYLVLRSNFRPVDVTD